MNKKPNDASSPNGKEKFEVADVFRLYGQDYRLNNPLPSDHTKVMRHIEICRTATLGGHIEQCDQDCQYIIFADDGDHIYNSNYDILIQTVGLTSQDVYISETMPADMVDIVFSIPNGDVYINGNAVESKATIILKSKNINRQLELMVDRHTGKVDISIY